MKAVVQRVTYASVSVEGKMINEIKKGLVVFAGLGRDDTEKDMEYLARKIFSLRIFPDGNKESALSVHDISGEILLISQFTLYGDVKKGNRPSFTRAMEASKAGLFFERFYEILKITGIAVKCGIFQAMMKIKLENDGPYTIVIDSK